MPGTILDIFNQNAFSASTLTGNINMVPNNYGRIRALGLFRDEPIPTTTVTVIVDRGVLNLLPTGQRGGPASLGTRGKQSPMAFVVPHIPHDDSVLATDVQNMLAAYGSQMQLENVLDYTNRKLSNMRLKHRITLEHLRVTALRGRVLDSDGRVIVDYFQRFGVTEKVVDFTLGSATADLVGLCRGVTGYMEDNLLGETMTGVHALCSPEWLAKFVSHPKFVQTYQYFARTGNDPLTVDTRKGFEFQGITFEEYRGAASYVQEDGTLSAPDRFIPAGEVRFFPVGTSDTFVNYWAPPDYWGGVNEAPIPADAEVFVAPLEPKKFGKGMDIHTESNPLPLVKRPALLVRGTSSN